jgi:hypothetical protein
VCQIEQITDLSMFKSFQGGWADKSHILALSLDNYYDWSLRVVRAMSVCCQLQLYLDCDTVPYLSRPRVSEDATDAEIESAENWDFNNLQALSCIQATIDHEEAREIMFCQTAREAWAILKSRHAKMPLVALYRLIEESFQLRLSRTTAEDMLRNMERLSTLSERIFAIGFPTRDMWNAIVILRSLDADLAHIRDSLLDYFSRNPFDINIVMTRIRLEADQLNYELAAASKFGGEGRCPRNKDASRERNKPRPGRRSRDHRRRKFNANGSSSKDAAVKTMAR